jgi:hypothetical protein
VTSRVVTVTSRVVTVTCRVITVTSRVGGSVTVTSRIGGSVAVTSRVVTVTSRVGGSVTVTSRVGGSLAPVRSHVVHPPAQCGLHMAARRLGSLRACPRRGARGTQVKDAELASDRDRLAAARGTQVARRGSCIMSRQGPVTTHALIGFILRVNKGARGGRCATRRLCGLRERLESRRGHGVVMAWSRRGHGVVTS